MKKQSAAGLFFSMFLRAAVIILGLSIIVFGVVLLTKVVRHEDATTTAASTVGDHILEDPETHDDLLYNTEDNTGETTTAADTYASSYDKNILVLNSTDVAGLAGRWCERLNASGYANTMASDFSTTIETTRIISTTDGVGQDLVQYFNGASYEVGTVTEGTMEDTSNYDIVIILGTNDNDQ